MTFTDEEITTLIAEAREYAEQLLKSIHVPHAGATLLDRTTAALRQMKTELDEARNALAKADRQWTKHFESDGPRDARLVELEAENAALRKVNEEGAQGEVGWSWQWCYVEKWPNDSGVYERVAFDTERKARRYLRENADHVADLNAEVTTEDRVIASVEKRRVYEPGPWVPAAEKGETDDRDR